MFLHCRFCVAKMQASLGTIPVFVRVSPKDRPCMKTLSDSSAQQNASCHAMGASSSDNASSQVEPARGVSLDKIISSDTCAACPIKELSRESEEPGKLSYDLREAYAFRLSQFYSPSQGGCEEHPVYTDQEWCVAVENPVGLREYWCWVAASIEADRAMWPWDREVSAAVLISRAARINVEYIAGAGWVARGDGASLIRNTSATTEMQAWTAAAQAVLGLPYLSASPEFAVTDDTPITELTYRISSRLALILQPLHDSSVASNFSEGGMRAFERTNSQWVRLCQAAGVEVGKTENGPWTVLSGPPIPELQALPLCRNEAETWKVAAEALVQHLSGPLELTEVMWKQKAPSQRVELFQEFYAEYRPAAPEEATAQHIAYEAKLLCLGLGWKVSRNRSAVSRRPCGWQLNSEGKYSSEPAAWLAGADQIRQQVMQQAEISFLHWASLTVDDKILLAQEHLI